MYFKKVFFLIKVIPKLGYWNVFYVFYYRLSLKIGLRKFWFKPQASVKGLFYNSHEQSKFHEKQWQNETNQKGENYVKGIFSFFSYHQMDIPGTDLVNYKPNWFYNPFDKKEHAQKQRHWTEINDFGEGDIKIFWELSRFDWLTDLIRAYRVSGEEKYLSLANSWLEDWSKNNPLNIGPNWKCGQETTFRLMKLLTAAFMLDQFHNPEDSLKTLIYQHVQRIEGNIYYGIAQDNNHGSSEAIGLYIGACWLIKRGNKSAYLTNWREKGRRLLEGRIQKLIQDQGSFSQRSMTYHRVMVDTMSFCLHMMHLLNEPQFDYSIKQRLIAFGEWQYKMTFGVNGDAPNYGSNDGARIENLYNNDYRDFRPSTQLFFALLTKERIYDDINVSEAMYWRCGKESLSYPMRKINLPESEILDNHILILRNENIKVFLKIPDDTFRPGNDPFHIDIWYNGNPVLIDSGSYSYNSGKLTKQFKSIASHNTVQFEDDEPMPSLGPFLNGNWIKPVEISEVTKEGKSMKWTGKYKDFKNRIHQRNILLSQNQISISDKIENGKNARTNFQFNPSTSMTYKIVKGTLNQSDIQKEQSLYYLEKQKVDSLSVSLEHNESQVIFYFDVNHDV